MRSKKRHGNHDYFGLKVYEVDGKEYAVGTKAQAEKAAKGYILDSLWAFNPNFIANVIGLSFKEEEAIGKMQREMSEDAGPIIRRLIGEKNLPKFVRDAIKEDGLAHFIAQYDHKQIRSDDVPGLPKGLLAFRTN